MNCTVTLDWKSFAAIGLARVGIIIAAKLDSNQAMEVSTTVVDACKVIGENISRLIGSRQGA